MSRNANKRHCAHPGCRAWALRGGPLCSVHAGRLRVARRQPPEIEAAPAPNAAEQRLPTLESEISLLAARRDEVDGWLKQQLGDKGKFRTAEALRYLAVLSQVGKSLATMLVQRAAMGSAGEIERFFDAVAERVRELQP